MHEEAELRRVLAALPTITVHGPWSRAVALHLLQSPPPGAPVGTPPQPLWSGGAPQRGARFTPRGGFDTIYLASDHHTALIEVQAIYQSTSGLTVTRDRQPLAIVSVDGVLANVLDLTDEAIRRRLGTTLAELTGDWLYAQAIGLTPPTQLLGRIAYETGRIVGLRYVSAKSPPTGTGLAAFADRLVPGEVSYLEVVDPHGLVRQRVP